MKLIKNSFSLAFLLFAITVAAQDRLSLEQAIETGLKNNYTIVLARNNVSIAANNNSLGNAGFLPTVTAGSNLNNNISSARNEYFNGNISEKDNAKSQSLNANVQLNWVIFDGFKMFVDKNRYAEMQNLSELQLRTGIENTIAEIILSYYNIVQQQKALSVLDNAIYYSTQRRTLMKTKLNIGAASEVDYLQACVDLNADSVAWLQQLATLQNLKADLNNLIGRDYKTGFTISDTIRAEQLLSYETLVSLANQNNVDIITAQSNAQIAQLNYQLTHSPVYPRVNVFGGYNMARSEAEVGIMKSARSQGPSYGLSVSYTLFNGFNNYRNSQNAKIILNTSKITMEETIENINMRLYQLFNDYQNNLTAIRFETESVSLARRNTFLTFERYKLGMTSDLDFRQTQYIQLETENRLLLAQYKAKQTETELLRISGQLIKSN